MSATGYPLPLSQADLDKYFPIKPRERLTENSYEFALVLAGTVSAGAYTAGVLDFILEALDAWTRAKEDGKDYAPKHDAILSTITGSSGGAIDGALFTRVASYGFPHGPVDDNPLYKTWVKGPTLTDLLAPDSGAQGLKSLFNVSTFSVLATNVVTVNSPPPLGTNNTPKVRSFLASPLRLTMMVASVTGVPYEINFRGESGLGHDMNCHTDYVRFALEVPGGVPNDKLTFPDSFALGGKSATNWDKVAAAALATSAFPAAFPSQPVTRPENFLGYRVAVVPGDNNGDPPRIAQLSPLWSAYTGNPTPGQIRSVNVDGGTLNNEPLDHARVALAGYDGRNIRDGLRADRGILLVDPFSDPEPVTLYDPPDFLGLLGPLVSTLVQQARFKPEDVALASDYDTYSRFLIAPVGVARGVSKVEGSQAIAAGGLGGFLGFIDSRLLDYDFKLGRYNAYSLLKYHFVLPAHNPLFGPQNWTDPQVLQYRLAEDHPTDQRPEYYLPIIPLMPDLALPVQPTKADWPKLSGVPSDLASKVVKRVDAVYAGLKASLQKSKAWPGALTGFAIDQAYNWSLRGTIRDKAVAAFTQALNDQNLLPTYVQKFPKAADGKPDPGKDQAVKAQAEWLASGATSSKLTDAKDGDKSIWVLTTVWP
ncbi:MAG TPA: patatin-like phospholipase family protein [Rhizomicrobium sp.]|jgi:hypothetical protein|nr:patatin-like phospholipase family protein [Rhizomicrobium sp.]